MSEIEESLLCRVLANSVQECARIKFLNTADTIREVRGLLELGEPIKAAVAYWGSGAVNNLGITGAVHLDIVCDVRSGGAGLSAAKNVRLRAPT